MLVVQLSVDHMQDTFLDKEEIQTLTNKTVRPAQVRALKAMGIEHKVRPDGSVAILRAHINKVFDGNPDKESRKTKTIQPNWGAI